jgi:hypothetical protein
MLSCWRQILQCRRNVLPVPPHAELLTRRTVGFAGISVIKCQRGDAGGGELLLVLSQQHLMRGP